MKKNKEKKKQITRLPDSFFKGPFPEISNEEAVKGIIPYITKEELAKMNLPLHGGIQK